MTWQRIEKKQLPEGWFGMVDSTSVMSEAQADCRDKFGHRTMVHVTVDGAGKRDHAVAAVVAAAHATRITGEER